ncbi:hypothetical protein [Embleya sp. MST-111070]|uniref:hypothetical protein n=1 Tax=Embleya sp. MST-111070 TaxID=3398231 RepID=UPI003F741BCF
MSPLQTLLTRPGDAPTLGELGGEENLWQAWERTDEPTAARLWFRVAETLFNHWGDLDHPQRAAAFITDHLTTDNRPAVTDDILDRLCEHPQYLEHEAARLNTLALERSNNHRDPLRAELAGIYLETALRLALNGTTTRYALLARLVDPAAAAAPAGYARRVVRALGAAYEHWRDAELADALPAFLTTPHIRADTAYEIAMCRLSDAFNAPDRPRLLDHLDAARIHLRIAVDADEDRPDAQAYLAAIEGILAFEAGQSHALRDAAGRLRRHVSEHRTWLTGLRTHWRDGRYDAEAAWYTLTETLEHVDAHLDEHTNQWPSRTIDQILTAYSAGRALRLLRSQDDAPGVSVLVTPRIEEAFARRNSLGLHLQAYIADAAPDLDIDTARQLQEAVTAGADPPDDPPDDSGKDLAAAFPNLAARIGHGVLADLPLSFRDNLPDLEQEIVDHESATAARLPVAEQEVFNSAIEILRECPDFRGPVRESYVQLLVQLIRFLANRTNRAQAHHSGRFFYLFDPEAKEEALQEDLADYLDGLCHEVDIEVTDRAGGRADIVVRFQGFETVIECKQRKHKTTKEGLARYLRQTSAYQATGVGLGGLAILDKTPKLDWIPSIANNLWAQHVSAPNKDRDRWVLIMRVPGNRVRPSDM